MGESVGAAVGTGSGDGEAASLTLPADSATDLDKPLPTPPAEVQRHRLEITQQRFWGLSAVFLIYNPRKDRSGSRWC